MERNACDTLVFGLNRIYFVFFFVFRGNAIKPSDTDWLSSQVFACLSMSLISAPEKNVLLSSA